MSDLIDRQAAIDAVGQYISQFDAIDANFLDGLKEAIDIVKKLPSAQPEQPEIIRCRECKFYDDAPCGIVDWWNSEDDFCSYAERREGW